MDKKPSRDERAAQLGDQAHELWEAAGEIGRSEERLRRTNEQWVTSLVRTARFKDDETAQHIERMNGYCELLADEVLDDSEQAYTIGVASRLHDIGKVAIPDEILLKAGPLTPEEKATMQTHTSIGHGILVGVAAPIAELAATIAVSHHERWDGSGYPSGLSEESTPIEGRIAAIADTFDALTTDRIYREALPLPEALRVMQAEADKQFDPRLLEHFFGMIDRVIHIQQRYPDTAEHA